MANGATGILTAQTTPGAARRAWPRWLVLGAAMIAVAVVAIVWPAAGARFLLGGLGLFLAARGVVLARGARTGAVTGGLADRGRRLGAGAIAAGAAALVLALASAWIAGRVLLVAVPVLLLVTALGLLGRRGPARRGGQALLLWSVLVTGLLVVTGIAQGWDRAAGLSVVVAALAVAVLGVPVLIAAVNLRSVANRPVPARSAACGGCACGAGGCGALG